MRVAAMTASSVDRSSEKSPRMSTLRQTCSDQVKFDLSVSRQKRGAQLPDSRRVGRRGILDAITAAACWSAALTQAA